MRASDSSCGNLLILRIDTNAHSVERNARGGKSQMLSENESRSAAVVGGVLLGKAGPLFRQVVLREDGRNRARRNACAAVDALDRINEQLNRLAVTVLVLLGVDAIDRTGVHTGGVLGADTGFCNDVGHD